MEEHKLKALRAVVRYVVVFLCVMACLTLMLTGVFLIPDKFIETHQETSLYILQEMEKNIWFGNFFGRGESRFDQQTDEIMLKNTISDNTSLSALQKAMYLNGYGRYWHGYVLFLRPLMVFFNLWEIRYINMIVFFVLFALVIALIAKCAGGKKGLLAAVAFSLSITLCYIVIITSCLQFFSVFLVMLIVSAVILGTDRWKDYPMIFMITGILTNFLDFLTVPLITLGMPILLLMMKQNEKWKDRPFLEQVRFIFCQSLSWGLGYGMCWVSKWVLSGWILPAELTDSSVSQHAFFWLGDGGAGSRLWAYRLNIPYYFASQGLKIMLLAMAVPLLLLIAGSIFHLKVKANAFGYLMVAVMPYLWYLVLNGHAFYHAWFTYRLQAVTLFGISLFLLERIDFERLQKIKDDCHMGDI